MFGDLPDRQGSWMLLEAVEGEVGELGDATVQGPLALDDAVSLDIVRSKGIGGPVAGKADILVSTSIIESGLDIPNANTIFIHEADMFGLADLHQLRGRVGRYKHRAYAYVMLPESRPVTKKSVKRLKAIEEYAELGSGFKLAMRDLEIRGAGNILGAEQHGHIAAVGYDMYCRLLEIAAKRARHEEVSQQPDLSITVGLTAFFPEGYIPDTKQRIEMYRKLSRAEALPHVDAVRHELIDRFGPPPAETDNLLAETRARVLAAAAGQGPHA